MSVCLGSDTAVRQHYKRHQFPLSHPDTATSLRLSSGPKILKKSLFFKVSLKFLKKSLYKGQIPKNKVLFSINIPNFSQFPVSIPLKLEETL